MWVFKDFYGNELVSFSDKADLDLAHNVLNAVALYYSKEI